MNAILRAAHQLQQVCEQQSWRFCFIGGLAVQRWGQPRLTVDVDAAVFTGMGSEEAYIDCLLRHFPGRRDDARQFALRARVLLMRTPQGVGIDASLAALPFEDRLIDRSSLGQFGPRFRLRTCSAEDLIVMKALADRDLDWLDIKGMLIRQGDRLDWRQIEEELLPLCELAEKPHVPVHLEQLRQEVAGLG